VKNESFTGFCWLSALILIVILVLRTVLAVILVLRTVLVAVALVLGTVLVVALVLRTVLIAVLVVHKSLLLRSLIGYRRDSLRGISGFILGFKEKCCQ